MRPRYSSGASAGLRGSRARRGHVRAARRRRSRRGVDPARPAGRRGTRPRPRRVRREQVVLSSSPRARLRARPDEPPRDRPRAATSTSVISTGLHATPASYGASGRLSRVADRDRARAADRLLGARPAAAVPRWRADGRAASPTPTSNENDMSDSSRLRRALGRLGARSGGAGRAGRRTRPRRRSTRGGRA